jgi:hypothetical protein
MYIFIAILKKIVIQVERLLAKVLHQKQYHSNHSTSAFYSPIFYPPFYPFLCLLFLQQILSPSCFIFMVS